MSPKDNSNSIVVIEKTLHFVRKHSIVKQIMQINFY